MYQEVEESGKVGIAIDSKMMTGSLGKIAVTHQMRNHGDTKGKCIEMTKKDWDSCQPFGSIDELQGDIFIPDGR